MPPAPASCRARVSTLQTSTTYAEVQLQNCAHLQVALQRLHLLLQRLQLLLVALRAVAQHKLVLLKVLRGGSRLVRQGSVDKVAALMQTEAAKNTTSQGGESLNRSADVSFAATRRRYRIADAHCVSTGGRKMMPPH